MLLEEWEKSFSHSIMIYFNDRYLKRHSASNRTDPKIRFVLQPSNQQWSRDLKMKLYRPHIFQFIFHYPLPEV
jgi:hypothetical protein